MPSALALTLGLVLFWAPLPFGSVTPVFRWVVWASVMALALLALWSRRERVIWQRSRMVVGCLVAIACLALLQSWSWPSGVVDVISPTHGQLTRIATMPLEAISASSARAERPAAVGASTATSSAEARAVPLSMAPRSSRQSAAGWMAAAAAVLCGGVLVSRRDRRWVLLVIVAAGVFQALYGGPRLFGGTDLIWGVEVPSVQGRFRGTFVNPNHAAFLLGMVVPLVTAWCWLEVRKLRDGDERGRLGVLWVGVPLAILAFLVGGLMLTQSRAAALVAVIVVMIQITITQRRHPWRMVAAWIVVPALALTVLVLSATGSGLVERLSKARGPLGSLSGVRLQVYGEVVDIWQRFPILGSGLGSFRATFAALGPADLPGQWWNAHSDWLELLATGGAFALVLVLIALVTVFRTLSRQLRSDSREIRAVSLGLIGSLCAAILHSGVDFGLAMPANALILATLCGMALAPSSMPLVEDEVIGAEPFDRSA